MAGLLFIFIITLAVYALNFKFAEKSQKEAEARHIQEKERLQGVVNQLINTRKKTSSNVTSHSIRSFKIWCKHKCK